MSSLPPHNGFLPIVNSGNEFSEGFTRIAQALKITTQLELADILNIRQSSISDAKRRGVIPGEWALKLFQQYRLNPRWVYDGLPPVFLSSPEAQDAAPASQESSSFLLKYPEGTVSAVKMSDASMEPSIRRNAFVGVYTRDKEMHADGLHALCLPFEGITVRRVRIDPEENTAILSADNPIIPRQRISLDLARESVIGRVIWVLSHA